MAKRKIIGTLRRKGRSGKFSGRLNGTNMHCNLLSYVDGSNYLRCESMSPGPGKMSREARRSAGVVSVSGEIVNTAISKGKALHAGGAKRGRLKDGCRYGKNKKTFCTASKAKTYKSAKATWTPKPKKKSKKS